MQPTRQQPNTHFETALIPFSCVWTVQKPISYAPNRYTVLPKIIRRLSDLEDRPLEKETPNENLCFSSVS